MHRFLTAIFILLAPFATAQDTSRTLSVTGSGAVSQAPDLADIRLGVETGARTAIDALRQNSVAMASVLDTLGTAGIDTKDIQTTQLSLYPQYDNRSSGRPNVSGYTASNMVLVRVRSLDNLGRILDEISGAGGNSIQSITFGIDDVRTPTDAARKAAVKDALAKADLYAEAAGLTLGPIVSLTESGSGSPQPQGMAMARAESLSVDVPIAGGELGITAQVHVIFGLE